MDLQSRLKAFGIRIFGFWPSVLYSDFRIFAFGLVFGFLDFGLRSKTEGLTQTGPNLDRDRSGPFSGIDGLGSVRSIDFRSVFGLH